MSCLFCQRHAQATHTAGTKTDGPPSLFRPMSEFDPSEPALVHDRRQDRFLPWSPSFQRSYECLARELTRGVVGLMDCFWMAG